MRETIMDKLYDYILLTLFVLLCLLLSFAIVVFMEIAIESKTIQGDMNNDGQLTIVDLSILAEVIRNQ